MDLNQVTLPAADVAASVAFYRLLGFEPVVLAEHYARFQAPSGNTTLSVHHMPAPIVPGQTVVYLECALLDDTVADLVRRGVEFSQAPRDEPWLWREARLSDPAGNALCLYQAGANRINPPWRVGGPQTPSLQAHALQSPRLQLRALHAGDLPAYFSINSDPRVTRYLPYAAWQSMDAATAWFERMTRLQATGSSAYWAVVEKSTGDVVGSVLLMHYDAACGTIELGYLLGASHWGRGFMREAARSVLDHAFGTLQVRRVEAHIDARNRASQKVVEALGFQREALLREAWKDQGTVSDATIYGLLQREWVTPA